MQRRYVTGLPGGIVWVLVVFVLQLSRAGAGSPTFEQGLDAYSTGDFTAAYRLWQPLAEGGDADAQFGLGLLYYDGIGVTLDRAKSSHWFLQAAKQGHAGAQYNLGNAYLHGDGVAANEAMAVHWWKKAADRDFAPARFMLAKAYQDGIGVGKDEQAAARLYAQLAGKYRPLGLAVNATFGETVQSAPEDDCASWLGNQPAGAYTIQLVSTSRPEGAIELARRQRLTGYVVCSSAQAGYTRYVLLLGVYSGATAANEAMAALPSELQKNRPWIRKISSLRNRLAGHSR